MNRKENMNESDDLASIGIGAMIVFIALILVAAVASAVIIQTGEKLQQNAQQTGSDTQEEIGGKISIITVWVGEQTNCDGDADGAVDACITLVYELAAGSEPMDENDVVWSISCLQGTSMDTVWGTFDGDADSGADASTAIGDGTVDTDQMNLDTVHVDGTDKCVDNGGATATGCDDAGDFHDDDTLQPGQVYMINLKTSADGTDEITQNQGECNPVINEQHELTISVAGGGTTTEILSYTSVTEGQSVV